MKFLNFILWTVVVIICIVGGFIGLEPSWTFTSILAIGHWCYAYLSAFFK